VQSTFVKINTFLEIQEKIGDGVAKRHFAMGLGANQTSNMDKLDIEDVNFHLLIKAELVMNVLLRLHTPNLGLTLGAFLIKIKKHGENVTMDKIVRYFTVHDKDNKVLLFITKKCSRRQLLIWKLLVN
jgi:hypothetical protein